MYFVGFINDYAYVNSWKCLDDILTSDKTCVLNLQKIIDGGTLFQF